MDNPRQTHGEPIGLDRSREEVKQQEQSSLRSDSSTAPPLDLTAPASDDKEARQLRNAAKTSAITDIAVAQYNRLLSKKSGGLLVSATKAGIDQRRLNVGRSLKVVSRMCESIFGDNRIRPEFWEGYFRRCADDPFLSGRQGGGKDHENWKPDFEYLTRPKTMLKLYEMHFEEGDE